MVQLRGDLTKKMEDGAGKVRFRRWKNMTIGALGGIRIPSEPPEQTAPTLMSSG